MKAIVVNDLSGLDGVRLQDFPKPMIRPRGVIVEVKTAALNFPDVLQPKGLYQDQPDTPFVLGLEFSGVVQETGTDCRQLKVGDRIVGMGQGALGEYSSAREQMCFKLPDSLSHDLGAAIPLAGGTAMYGLRYCVQLAAGETLVVLGAAGGTGNYAVQIGKALGARVIAVCSSVEKVRSVLEAGADVAINYREEDLGERLKELTDNRGVDVVYDPVGGDLFDICSRRMAMGGRLLIVGFASGRIPDLGVNMPLIKSYSVVGTNWSLTAWNRPDISMLVMEELFTLCERGLVRPTIDKIFPLDQAKMALSRLESREAIGKTLVQVG